MSRYAAVAIAALALAAACSDANVAAPTVKALLTGPVTKIDTLRGTIRLNGDDAVNAGAVVLVTAEGAEVTLIGPVADLLANAAGVDIWIAGEYTATGEMMVQSYAFRSTDDPSCLQPIVKILPDLGVPCGDLGAIRPLGSNNTATWNKHP